MYWFWIIIAIAAGAMLPAQGGLNTRLGLNIGNSAWASLISFAIGTLTLVAYVLATKQTGNFAHLRELPASTWLGGVLGAVYVTLVVVLYPKLGPSLAFCLIVFGQLLLAMILEHFGWLDTPLHTMSWARLGGLALVLIGIYVIKQY